MSLGGIIGGAIGTSFGYPQLGAALGQQFLGGGLFGDYGSGSAREAIDTAAKLAEDIRFRPVTVGTTSGVAALDPQAGEYGVALAPAYASVLGSALGGAGSLFQQLASFDPRQREREVFEEQVSLLQPEFERQEERLRQGMFGSGRLGLQLAGEGVGAGAGSGMVQPDVFGLGTAQQQTLAKVAAGSRQQALGEAQQLGQLAQGMLQSGMSISEMERQLIGLGIDAETARSAAEFGAARIAMDPYEYLFSASQAKSTGQDEFFGNLFQGLGGFGGGGGSTSTQQQRAASAAAAASDIRLKENIEKVSTLPNGLNVYTWDWNDTAKKVDAPKLSTRGVIAQEVLNVVPEAVMMHDSGYLMVNYAHPELKGVY